MNSTKSSGSEYESVMRHGKLAFVLPFASLLKRLGTCEKDGKPSPNAIRVAAGHFNYTVNYLNSHTWYRQHDQDVLRAYSDLMRELAFEFNQFVSGRASYFKKAEPIAENPSA